MTLHDKIVRGINKVLDVTQYIVIIGGILLCS